MEPLLAMLGAHYAQKFPLGEEVPSYKSASLVNWIGFATGSLMRVLSSLHPHCTAELIGIV